MCPVKACSWRAAILLPRCGHNTALLSPRRESSTSILYRYTHSHLLKVQEPHSNERERHFVLCCIKVKQVKVTHAAATLLYIIRAKFLKKLVHVSLRVLLQQRKKNINSTSIHFSLNIPHRFYFQNILINLNKLTNFMYSFSKFYEIFNNKNNFEMNSTVSNKWNKKKNVLNIPCPYLIKLIKEIYEAFPSIKLIK